MRVAPSGIRRVFERALELERGGREIVHLEIGRPHLSSPAVACEAAERAIRDGHVHYTPNRGLLDLREAIARHMRARGQERDPETEIVVTAGGSEAVFACFAAILEAGDEVLVLDPAWPHYAPQVELAGGAPVHVACSVADGFQPDPARVAAAVSSRTRAVVVSSPCNPTGAVWEPERLGAIAELACARDLVVLSDEIYERFVYDRAEHVSIAGLPGMRERTVVANSMSKSYSMTGWRVGWAAAAAPIADAINAVHQYLTVCAPSFAQHAAKAALDAGEPFVRELVAECARRRVALVAALETLPGVELPVPAGAFYAFPSVASSLTGEELAMLLLERHGVAVVPGPVFGAGLEAHLRISYAVEEATLQKGVERLREGLASVG